MCNLCAKGFFDHEFNSVDIDKISNFNEIASNFTYLCTSKFIKYNLTDTDHLLLKSKFYGRGKSGMYFCIFGSCQPLSGVMTESWKLTSSQIIVRTIRYLDESPIRSIYISVYHNYVVLYCNTMFIPICFRFLTLI